MSNEMNNNNSDNSNNSLWVFGYGSLCWLPGFEYGSSVVGHVKGFSRKFWQGNVTHRGTPNQPGRVATLMEEKDALTHGVAFELLGEAALDYLGNREVTLGGYQTTMTTFHPQDPTQTPFTVLLYMATPTNEHWLGAAPLNEVAQQVVQCSGPSGHNVEYVLKLAEWVREKLPEVTDEHLFTLEELIKEEIAKRKLCEKSLLRRECSKCIEPDFSNRHSSVRPPSRVLSTLESIPGSPEPEIKSSFNFSSEVGSRRSQSLRCVKI